MRFHAPISAAVVLTLGSSALADPTDFEGRWSQISSTGGDCASCALTIAKKGELIQVEANNGWTAELASTTADGRMAAVGTGLWPSWDHRPVHIVLSIDKRGSLTMRMEIRHPDGKIARVHAVFRRELLS